MNNKLIVFYFALKIIEYSKQVNKDSSLHVAFSMLLSTSPFPHFRCLYTTIHLFLASNDLQGMGVAQPMGVAHFSHAFVIVWVWLFHHPPILYSKTRSKRREQDKQKREEGLTQNGEDGAGS